MAWQAPGSSGSSPGATCAIRSGESQPDADRRAWCCWRWASLGRWPPRTCSSVRPSAPPGECLRGAPADLGGVPAHRRRSSAIILGAADHLPGRAVRLVHGVHRHLDLRGVPGHGGADHRAVGDVGLRGRSQGEDPRRQGRRRDHPAATTGRSPTGEAVAPEDRRRPGRASASTPYLESEVMLERRRTPAAVVILRGIDPETAPGVLGPRTRPCARARSTTWPTPSG